MKLNGFKPGRFIAVLLVVAAFFIIGIHRLDIDTDVIKLLPQKDPAISDALYLFKNHPIMEQLVIDIGHTQENPDLLVDWGDRIERRLKQSSLFKSVGFDEFQRLIPELMTYIVAHIPVLFTAEQLESQVLPMIETGAVEKRLNELYWSLLNLEGIGQTEFIEKDPLGFKDLVLARLSALAPPQNARLYKGKLLSADGKHLLVIATPISSGTDSQFAKKIEALMQDLKQELRTDQRQSGSEWTLTPMGAYRAALDNERIMRQDVKKAIILSTLGVALLLLCAFPRPYIGLLSLLPALAGTLTAFFVFSLLFKSISIMVLGFGGAIISISVDYGIAYLLFLDRPQQTSGREASREVRSCGLLAALTTVGAFGALYFSGFPLFEQLGLFTAIGISLSFLFVHMVFPLIFPVMPPARSKRLPLQGLVNTLARAGNKGAFVLLVFFVIMLFHAKPGFDVSLTSMNTVGKDTAAAEKLLSKVWGQVFNRIYLNLSGDSVEALQQKGDRLLQALDAELSSGTLTSGFVPSEIFPGKDRSTQNLAAWKNFWSPGRVEALTRTLQEVSVQLGFKADAFEGFYNSLKNPPALATDVKIPEKFLGLMNITRSAEEGAWNQVVTLTAAETHDSEKFYEKYHPFGKIFDPVLFSQRLGALFFSTFLKMAGIIGFSVVLLLLLFFLDLELVLVALLPIVFAFASTLGTLTLLGRPLDIPGLMLSVIIIGMGIDYALFFVRTHQRYGDPLHPSYGLIRLAVFMSSASTIIGFSVLCTAQHTLLRSAGLTSLLGIGYAAVGAFIILPPVLKHVFQKREKAGQKPEDHHQRVLARYRLESTFPRLFVRFKIQLDPMFAELPALMESRRAPAVILDIGCGYGAPACWLLERFPGAKLYGIDPDNERVRVAARAVGENGVISLGRAPDIPVAPAAADLVMLFDMIHYIPDDDLMLLLQRISRATAPEAGIIIRAALPPVGNFPFGWWWEQFNCRLRGIRCHYRLPKNIKEIIETAGYSIRRSLPSGSKNDLIWIEAVRPKEM